MSTQFDMTLMREIQQHAEHLKAEHSERNSMFDEMEDMYLMNWSEEGSVSRRMHNTKITKSPDARNALQGAIRLLIATDPQWSVPFDQNQADAKGKSEKIEKMAERMWTCAGRVRQDPVHYDVVLSMLLFGETHIAVTRTADMVEHAKGASRAAEAKANEIAALTPYVFDVWDPRSGYPEFGPYGVTAFYREVETTSGAVLDEFGDEAKPFYPGKGRYDTTTLCHFWDYENRVTWVKGNDKPLIQEVHGLPFIPVVVQLGEGSRLFSEPEYQRQPFLYTLWKSGLWNRQNLMLSVLYTMIFAFGSNPLYIFKRNNPSKELELDFSRPGGVAYIDRDEELMPMAKAVMDPSFFQGVELADQKSMESTIFSQTLGEPLGKNAPFSMVALLHQAGRLPLLVPQRKSSWGIADAVKVALRWMKEGGGKVKAGYEGNQAEIKPSEIPEHFELEARLDIALPQDRLQMANIATMIATGEDPLVSQRWAREEILNIGQSEEMTKEILGEQATKLLAQQLFAQWTLQIQQLMNQVMNPQAGQAPPMPGQMPPMPGQEPPMPGPQPEVQPPLTGLPPEMAQAGGQPIQPVPPMGPELPEVMR